MKRGASLSSKLPDPKETEVAAQRSGSQGTKEAVQVAEVNMQISKLLQEHEEKETALKDLSSKQGDIEDMHKRFEKDHSEIVTRISRLSRENDQIEKHNLTKLVEFKKAERKEKDLLKELAELSSDSLK